MTTTTFTSVKLNDRFVPHRVATATTIFHVIDVATLLLEGTPDADDEIEILDLPANVRIIDASLRVSGDIAESGSTIALEAEQATDIALTSTLSAEAAGSIRMAVAPPPVYDDTTTIKIAMATAALSAAATGTIETMLVVEYP